MRGHHGANSCVKGASEEARKAVGITPLVCSAGGKVAPALSYRPQAESSWLLLESQLPGVSPEVGTDGERKKPHQGGQVSVSQATTAAVRGTL